MLSLVIGAIGSKDSNTYANINLLLSSNNEEEPYVKPCNSLETCFTIAKEVVINKSV